MIRGMISFSFLLLISCSTSVVEKNGSLEGVWVWENVELANQQNPILKKHILTLESNSYQESFFENSIPKGQEEGILLINRNGNEVSFSVTGNVQTVYQGVVSGNQLMISAINGKKISPPALYKKY